MRVRRGGVFRAACLVAVTSTGLACPWTYTVLPPVAPVAPVRMVFVGTPTNLDSLRTSITASLVGEEHTRKRKIQGMNLSVNVKIRAVAHTGEIDSASGPLTPMVVAWIQNQNHLFRTEDPIFQKKQDAEYLVQVFRDPDNGTARYQILEIPSSSTGTVTQIKTGAIMRCNHIKREGVDHDADFKDCDGYAEPFPTLGPTALMKQQMPLMTAAPTWSAFSKGFSRPGNAFGEDPTWVDCNAGCCTLVGT
jgi:hypothetical protein